MTRIVLFIACALLTKGVYASEFSDLQVFKTADLGGVAVKADIPAPMPEISSERSAGKFNYQCNSVDEANPYSIKRITLAVNGKGNPWLFSFTLTQREVTEKYLVDTTYKPKPGGAMEGFLRLKISDAHYSLYADGAITPFYAESSLLTGGYKLNNGKMGGFIKTAGWGYSWAKYICTR